MNYFGLFFTFMLPGIIIGIMIAVACKQERELRRRKAARARRVDNNPVHSITAGKSKLYIYDMNAA